MIQHGFLMGNITWSIISLSFWFGVLVWLHLQNVCSQSILIFLHFVTTCLVMFSFNTCMYDMYSAEWLYHNMTSNIPSISEGESTLFAQYISFIHMTRNEVCNICDHFWIKTLWWQWQNPPKGQCDATIKSLLNNVNFMGQHGHWPTIDVFMKMSKCYEFDTVNSYFCIQCNSNWF